MGKTFKSKPIEIQPYNADMIASPKMATFQGKQVQYGDVCSPVSAQPTNSHYRHCTATYTLKYVPSSGQELDSRMPVMY
jgi:hypothetical protein